MTKLLTPADIEGMARRANIPMAHLCRLAGVSPSIFSRWKSGETEPSLANYRRIRDAAESAVAAVKRRSAIVAAPTTETAG